MEPDAVFFLSDGTFDAKDVINAASMSKDTPIHSIAFFSSGGGLPEIADMTGGTYREIHTLSDLS